MTSTSAARNARAPARRPPASNDNRPQYQPAPYTGDGLECVRNLTGGTAPSDVLHAVAKWHEQPRYRGDARHAAIAAVVRRAVV